MAGATDQTRRSASRPWGLRGLRPAAAAAGVVPEFRFDPVRQVALTSDGVLWCTGREPHGDRHWSSVAELDGDEGRSETYGWDDGKDVTEGV